MVVRSKTKSPLRELQKDHVREMVMEALGQKLASGGLNSISMAAVAKEAGIGLRTLYRYFPSKAMLIKELHKWSAAKIHGGTHQHIRMNTPEDFIVRRREGFMSFDRQPNLMKAYLVSEIGRQVKAVAIKGALTDVDTSLGEITSGLSERKAKRVKAAMHLIFSGDAWQFYREYWKIDGKEAGATSGWIAKLILDAVRKGDDIES